MFAAAERKIPGPQVWRMKFVRVISVLEETADQVRKLGIDENRWKGIACSEAMLNSKTPQRDLVVYLV